jgi:hypothetical protein
MSSEAVSSPTTGSEDARGRGAASARVGMFAPFDLLERGPEAARAFLARAVEAGIDHVCCGDHVCFAGAGFDGLVQATALAMLHPTLPIDTARKHGQDVMTVLHGVMTGVPVEPPDPGHGTSVTSGQTRSQSLTVHDVNVHRMVPRPRRRRRGRGTMR